MKSNLLLFVATIGLLISCSDTNTPEKPLLPTVESSTPLQAGILVFIKVQNHNRGLISKTESWRDDSLVIIEDKNDKWITVREVLVEQWINQNHTLIDAYRRRQTGYDNSIGGSIEHKPKHDKAISKWLAERNTDKYRVALGEQFKVYIPAIISVSHLSLDAKGSGLSDGSVPTQLGFVWNVYGDVVTAIQNGWVQSRRQTKRFSYGDEWFFFVDSESKVRAQEPTKSKYIYTWTAPGQHRNIWQVRKAETKYNSSHERKPSRQNERPRSNNPAND